MTSTTPLSTVADLRARPLTEVIGASWGPPQYTNWIDESLSWKESAYLGDWTWLPTQRLRGPDVLRLFSDVSVNSMTNFAVGRSKHIIQCDDDGKIIDDAILSRVSEDEFLSFSTRPSTPSACGPSCSGSARSSASDSSAVASR